LEKKMNKWALSGSCRSTLRTRAMRLSGLAAVDGLRRNEQAYARR
jgi:hypothetical protein